MAKNFRKYADLSDEHLHALLKCKASEERGATLVVIEVLEEADFRKSYLDLKYGSLLDFCVGYLKYSESSAYRRIYAMRLGREFSEVKKGLYDGSLNLVNVAKAHSLFKYEAKKGRAMSKDEKRAFLKSIENKSKAEAEKIFAEKSDLVFNAEKVTPLKNKNYQLKIEITEEILEKIKKVKSLISHSKPGANIADCIEVALDLALANLEKKPKRESHTATPPVKSKNPRYISPSKRRIVRQMYDNRCGFVSMDGQRCNSTHQLETDHIISIALGGTSEIENLRLVCRAHNQHYAEKIFGKKFMDKFKKKTKPKEEMRRQ